MSVCVHVCVCVRDKKMLHSLVLVFSQTWKPNQTLYPSITNTSEKKNSSGIMNYIAGSVTCLIKEPQMQTNYNAFISTRGQLTTQSEQLVFPNQLLLVRLTLGASQRGDRKLPRIKQISSGLKLCIISQL